MISLLIVSKFEEIMPLSIEIIHKILIQYQLSID